MMILGVDFDNTIVCYDRLFHRLAVERGLVSETFSPIKDDVRDHLRRMGKEDVWTQMQGYAYGVRMAEAEPFPGVEHFFERALRSGISLRIISHKTKQPFKGPVCDLHQAAKDWLAAREYFGVGREHVYFELTKQEKLKRMALCRCDYFIDDLPEILDAPDFPDATQGILFDPHGRYSAQKNASARSWQDLSDRLLS